MIRKPVKRSANISVKIPRFGRRLPRSSPHIQNKFSHFVESIIFSQGSRISYPVFLWTRSAITKNNLDESFHVLFCYVEFCVGLWLANGFYFAPESTGVEETNILLDCWGAQYESLKLVPVSRRKTLWSQILKSVLSNSAELGLTTNKNLEQDKKRMKTLEYEYHQARTGIHKWRGRKETSSRLQVLQRIIRNIALGRCVQSRPNDDQCVKCNPRKK